MSSLVRVLARVVSRSADSETLKIIVIFSLLGLLISLVVAMASGIDFGAILSEGL